MFVIYRLLVLAMVATLVAACAPAAPPAPTAAPSKPAEAAKPTEAAKPAAAAKPAEVKPAASPAAAPVPQPTVSGAAAAKPADGIRKGGTLRVGLYSDPGGLDPHILATKASSQVFKSVYNTLVGLDADLRLVPELAESWETPDPKTYVLKLRKGVKFHDGADFNAAAAKANLDRILDPATKSPVAADISTVASVEAGDEFTLKLTLKQPDAALLTSLSGYPGTMISPTAIQKFGADLARNPVGTGPFQFVEYVKDDHITVKKFAGYWDAGKPHLDEVIFKPIPDDAVKLSTLRANGVDIIDTVEPRAGSQLRGGRELVFMERPTLDYSWIILNMTTAPFDNKALRQAMAWGIDRDVVVKALLFESGAPAQSPFSPTSWAHDPSFKPYKRDVAQAKAKLAEGGMPQGFKAPFQVVNRPLNIQMGQVFKEQLAEVGIDLEIEVVEQAAHVSNRREGKFVASANFWTGRPDPDGNVFNWFHSTGGQNYAKYNSPKVDDLLLKARSSLNQEERKGLYLELAKVLADDVPMVFLYHEYARQAASPKVQGYKLAPDALYRLADTWLTP
jgi:peptide/nickel transport system substrate-binding protein